MKAIKNLKNQITEDIQALMDATIETAENNAKMTFSDFQEITKDKKRNTLFDFLFFVDYDERTEPMNFKYDSFEFMVSPENCFVFHKELKSALNGCPDKKQVEKRCSFDKKRSMSFQEQIEDFRNDYNGFNSGSEENKTAAKNRVLSAYKKAKPNDLIRLCWKYITDPQKIEGVNIPYSEEQKVIFTPYKECVNLPQFVQYKKAI